MIKTKIRYSDRVFKCQQLAQDFPEDESNKLVLEKTKCLLAENQKDLEQCLKNMKFDAWII